MPEKGRFPNDFCNCVANARIHLKGNSIVSSLTGLTDAPTGTVREAWSKTVEREVLESLPESEINRQT